MKALNEGKDKEAYTEDNTLLYDLAFMKDGKELEPTEGNVSVTFDFKDNQLAEDLGAKKASDVNVIHLPLKDSVRDKFDSTKAAKSIDEDDINKEEIKDKDLDVSLSKETVEFKLDSFSGVAFTVPTEEQGSDDEYVVSLKFLNSAGDEVNESNIGDYFVLVKQGDAYYYEKVGTNNPIHISTFSNNTAYDPTMSHEVSVIKSNQSYTTNIETWMITNGQYDTINEGAAVGNYALKSITSNDSTATVTFAKNPSIDATIRVYDSDGTTPYAPTDADLGGNKFYAVAVLVAEGADKNSEPVAWAITPVDIKGNSTIDLSYREFYAYGTDGGSKDTTIIYDPDQYDLGGSRGISLYRTTGGQTPDTYKQLQQMIEDGNITDQIVDNFEYTGNTTLNVNTNPGEHTYISFKKAYNKQLQIKLDLNDNVAAFKNSDNLYLFIEVDHQTSRDSFYLKKIVPGTDGIITNEDGDIIVPIPNWMDNNGNPKNDKYTGKENRIHVRLINGSDNINMNNVIAGTNCAIVEEGNITCGYTVHYDFSDEAGDAIVEADDANKVNTYTKVIELERVNISPDYDFRSILGPGIGYGITADRLEQGGSDFQSNFAVNNYKDGGKGVNPDLSGSSSGALAIGNYVTYNEDGTVAAIDPDGKVFIGNGHGSDLILYTDSADRVRDYRPWVHTIETTPDEVAEDIVEPTISHMETVSAELAAHAPNVTPTMTSDKVTIDTTSYPDGTTIYVDADALDAKYGSFSSGPRLNILKKQNQTIVFNFTEMTDVFIDQFIVSIYDDDGNIVNGWKDKNSEPNTGNAGGDIHHQNSLVDELCKTVVWNLASANNVTIEQTAGIFLIPDENSKTDVGKTSTGWIISDGYIHNTGEWHFAWADLNEVDTIELTALKKITRSSDKSGAQRIPSENQKFDFEFSQWVGNDWVVRSTHPNTGAAVTYRSATPEKDGQGNIISSELNDGWNVYRIKELGQSSTTVGEYDLAEDSAGTYYALVEYKTYNTTDKIVKIATLKGYYKEFDTNAFDPNAEDPSAFVSGRTANTSFINEQKTGDLEVGKELENAAADDATKFTFTITLKYDEKPVSGIFKYSIDGGDKKNIEFKSGIATIELGAGEKAHIEGLPAGVTYSISEKPVTGYFVKNSTNPDGTIENEVTTSAEFVNTAVGELMVQKSVSSNVAADSDKDFRFRVTLDDKTINGKYGGMTFENGVAEFTLQDGDSLKAENLPVGVKYEVEELDVEADFESSAEGAEGTINAEIATASFLNSRVKEGKLTVKKQVESDNEADKTTPFHFTVTLGKISGTFDDIEFTNGSAEIGPLTAGNTVRVTGLPDHIKYIITSDPALSGTFGGMTFENGVCEYTSSDGSITFAEGAELKDHKFTIALSITGTYGEMEFVDGVAEFTLKDGETKTAINLPLDIPYTVTETEDGKDGFTTTWTGKTGAIAANSSAMCVNKKENNKGKITLTKTDESAAKKLAGAEFDLYRVKTEDETADVKINSAALITNDQGVITVEDLEPGEYYFVETKAPKGYATPTGDDAKTETKEVVAGPATAPGATVSMTNKEEAKGKITLTRTDKSAAKKLAGAEFDLYRVKTGDETADVRINTQTLTTDAQGTITVNDLEPGEYYFVETKAPKGYVTPTGDAAKTETKTVEAGQATLDPLTVEMTNTEEAKGEITLTKTDKSKAKNLAGAEFDLYRVKTGDETADVKINTQTLTTDAQGTITVNDLEPGEYYFVETKAPDGYVTPIGDAAKTETRVVEAGKTSLDPLTVSMTNTEEAKGTIILTKEGTDKEKLAGAEFDLYLVRTLLDKKINDSPLETDENGQIIVTGLEPGVYYFKETKAPKGYLTPTGDDAKTETRTVEAGQATLDPLEISMTNTEEAKGMITLIKTGADEEMLVGAEFDLYRVKTGDEEKDAKINSESLVTNGQGKIVVSDLEPGSYYFVETKAPEGYVTPEGDAAKTETKTVEAGQATLEPLTVEMTNTGEAKGTIILTKEGKDSAKLAGAEFDLYRVKTGDETADVKINEQTLITGEDGTITIEDLEPGTYYFVETKAPKGYVTPNEEEAKTETRTVEAGQAELEPLTVSMTNTAEGLGKIILTKKDAYTKQELAGAEFDVYRVKTEDEPDDVKINEAPLVTNESGAVSADNLEPGTYYFVETKAPEDYKLPEGEDAKSELVEVKAGQKEVPTAEIEMTNDRAYGELLLTKEIDGFPQILDENGDPYEHTNATISFRITGTMEDGTEFDEYKNVYFNAESGKSDTVSMKVPVGIELTVTETYSGNYEPEEKTKTIQPETLIKDDPETGQPMEIPYYKVTFKNHLVNHTHTQGIINQYGSSDGQTVIEERIGVDD